MSCVFRGLRIVCFVSWRDKLVYSSLLLEKLVRFMKSVVLVGAVLSLFPALCQQSVRHLQRLQVRLQLRHTQIHCRSFRLRVGLLQGSARLRLTFEFIHFQNGFSQQFQEFRSPRNLETALQCCSVALAHTNVITDNCTRAAKRRPRHFGRIRRIRDEVKKSHAPAPTQREVSRFVTGKKENDYVSADGSSHDVWISRCGSLSDASSYQFMY